MVTQIQQKNTHLIHAGRGKRGDAREWLTLLFNGHHH